MLKTSELVGSAHLHGGLWILNSSPKSAGSALISKGETIDIVLWHQRLGHLGEDNMKRLQENQMVKELEKPFSGSVKGFCEGCNAGKQHREPFPKNDENPREKLEIGAVLH